MRHVIRVKVRADFLNQVNWETRQRILSTLNACLRSITMEVRIYA
jgi:hypothetical protein